MTAHIEVDDNKAIVFTDLISVASSGSIFSQAGDSGAPVSSTSDRRLIGFVFAGSEQVTFVMPIGRVLQALNVRLLTAKP